MLSMHADQIYGDGHLAKIEKISGGRSPSEWALTCTLTIGKNRGVGAYPTVGAYLGHYGTCS